LGTLKSSTLFDVVQPQSLIRFMIKEVEDTWRNKFMACSQSVGKKVDQMVMIVDLKGATLKELSSRQT
jgi:hypothetical protein